MGISLSSKVESLSFLIACWVVIFSNSVFAIDEVSDVTSGVEQELSETLSCQQNFEQYDCQRKIDEAGSGQRTNFIDCSSNEKHYLKRVRQCAGASIVGLGLHRLAMVAPEVLLPVVGGVVLFNALKKEEECYYDASYKSKIARPLAVIHGQVYADMMTKRLSCIDLQKLVVMTVEPVLGKVFTKQLNQERYTRDLEKRPGQEDRLDRSYPENERLLNQMERNLLSLLERIKEEEDVAKSTMRKINEAYRCASFEYKLKIFCSLAAGEFAGVRAHFAEKSPKLLSPSGRLSNSENDYSTPYTSRLLGDGVERVGKKNVNIVENNGVVERVEIKLPNGDTHRIRVKTGKNNYGNTENEIESMGFSVKVDRRYIESLGIENLPISAISSLKEINIIREGGFNLPAAFVHLRDGDIINMYRLGSGGDAAVFAHEMGHVVHRFTPGYVKVWERAILSDGGGRPTAVTPYGATKLEEDFAESLMVYLTPNERLRSIYRRRFPNRFSALDNIFRGNDFTKRSTIELNLNFGRYFLFLNANGQVHSVGVGE